MPFATPPEARPASRRTKRIMLLAGGIVAVIVAGVAIWSVFTPGSYGTSKNGCISITLPGSTGGGQMHSCGTAARAMCASAFTHDDKISRLARPQCRLAGLAAAP